MIGAVHNGEQLEIAFPFFTGTARVQTAGEPMSFAVVARRMSCPQQGTIGDRPAVVTSLAKSDLIPAMVVAEFRFTDEG